MPQRLQRPWHLRLGHACVCMRRGKLPAASHTRLTTRCSTLLSVSMVMSFGSGVMLRMAFGRGARASLGCVVEGVQTRGCPPATCMQDGVSGRDCAHHDATLTAGTPLEAELVGTDVLTLPRADVLLAAPSARLKLTASFATDPPLPAYFASRPVLLVAPPSWDAASGPLDADASSLQLHLAQAGTEYSAELGPWLVRVVWWGPPRPRASAGYFVLRFCRKRGEASAEA